MRRFSAFSILVIGLLTLLALPLNSAGQQKNNVVDDLLENVDQTLRQVTGNVGKLMPPGKKPGQGTARNGVAPRQAQPADPGGYKPPLHGTNPHGQGQIGVVDLGTTAQRPLPVDPAAAGEEVVIGRSRGEQDEAGNYSSHITLASLLGAGIIEVNANEGQSNQGPLDPIQTGLLDQLCSATAEAICLQVLRMDAAATNNGATTDFAVTRASIGGVNGVNAGVAESQGNISQDANCQTSRGNGQVAGVGLLGLVTANAVQGTSESRACSDGTQTQTQTGRVVELNGVGIPLPTAQGCANGTPNTTGLIPNVAQIVCNANDQNSGQAGLTYGVREGLSAFLLGTVLKATTGAGESRAVASPAGPGTNPPGGGGGGGGNDDDGGSGGDNDGGDGNDGNGDGGAAGDGDGNAAACADGIDNDGDGLVDFPNDPGCASANDDSEGGGGDAAQCADGIDNDGDGKVDFPDDPQCSSRDDDSEADSALALTGTNLLLTFLIGALVLLLGLRLREATGRPERGPAH